MATISVRFDSIGGTEAARGVSGGHEVVADRPDGVAGGQGLGFNGGQLLALAIGGCLCNDLRYAAHDAGVALGAFGLDVDVEVVDGRVTGVRVRVEGDEEGGVAALLERAVAGSTIVRAVIDGAPVDVVAVG
jgi:organic hydroperoxide reductase OsmC/OhrA